MDNSFLQLQREVMKADFDLLGCLVQARVFAFQKGDTQFLAWIDDELHGYQGKSDCVPDYRKIVLTCWGHVKGEGKWKIIPLGDNNCIPKIGILIEPCSTLTTYVKGNRGKNIGWYVSEKVCSRVSVYVKRQYWVDVDAVMMVYPVLGICDILQTVRQKLIEWVFFADLASVSEDANNSQCDDEQKADDELPPNGISVVNNNNFYLDSQVTFGDSSPITGKNMKKMGCFCIGGTSSPSHSDSLFGKILRGIRKLRFGE